MKKMEKSLSQLQTKFPSLPGIEKDTQTGCIMRKIERKNGIVRTAKRWYLQVRITYATLEY
jgi:hypothetical protein